jgi:hypothetical protein
MNIARMWTVLATAILAATVYAGSATAQTRTIVLSDDFVPEGNGQFNLFENPVINNTGQIAFNATLKNTIGGAVNDTGVYLYNGSTLLNRARENDLVPEGNGRFDDLAGFDPALNNSGQVTLLATLKNTSGGTADNSGIYLHNGSALVNVVRENALVPGGNGRFDFLSYAGPAANNSGQVAFPSTLKSTSGGSLDDTGLFFYNGTAVVTIARENALVPEGNGRFDSVAVFAAQNDAGQIAFSAGLRNTSGGTADDSGVYLYNGSALVNLARENALAPDGNGRFDGFSSSGLNNSGQVVFYGFLKNTSGGTADDLGIYLHNGSAVVNLARKNDSVPEGNGQISGFFSILHLNDAGQVVFGATLKNTSGGTTDNSGIYLQNGTAVVNIARENAFVQEGNGQFNSFNVASLNNGGQVGFDASLKNTSGGTTDDRGIYLADGQEQLNVVRKGDVLAGRTISSLQLAVTGALNDFAQITYQAAFTDGTQGVFLFTPQIHWRSGSSGDWDTASNWTLSIQPGQPHDVTIDPASNLTVNGPAGVVNINSLTVGGGAGAANLHLQSGGAVTTAAGLSVQATGAITGAGGLSVNGNLTVDGGTIDLATGGTLLLAPSTTLTVQGGGSAWLADNFSIQNSVTSVTGSGSSLQTDAQLDIGSAATVQVSAGGALSAANNLNLGADGTSGTLVVDGLGSAVTVTAGSLAIGHASLGAAAVSVVNNAALTASATELNATGSISIDGGTVNLGVFTNNGGVVNFTTGSLTYIGNLTVGTGGLLGTNLTLNSDRQLTLSGTTTIDPSRALTLAGGTLNTGNLVVNGTFNFNSGTLGFTQAGTSINVPIVSTTPNTIINILANNIALGNAASFSGFNHQGILNVGSNSVTLNSAGYSKLGVFTSLNGGTIHAPNGVSFGNGSNLLGHGAVSARVTSELGSVIEADGALALGDAASPAGYSSNGELRTKQFAVTLNSSAQATLGNLTTLGNGASPGTLNAPNGLVVDFGHSLVGFGAVNSSNTLAKRTVINGLAQGNSVGEPLTLSGYIKGVGTFNNVSFTGTFDPGLSPTLMTVGNIAFSQTSLLNIEIGGLVRGSGYDAILAGGQLSFAGNLQIALINGFTPSRGNEFDILDWSSLSGAFSSLQLPSLVSPLRWNVGQLYADGTLSVVDSSHLPGDFNRDTQVTAADIPVMLQALTNVPGYETQYGVSDSDLLAIGDFDNSGAFTNADMQGLLYLLSHGGIVLGSPSPAAPVPEPTSIVLLGLGGLAIAFCRRSR